MNVAIWTLAAYLCGSLPFSVWMGRLFLGTEIREFGDGNPGGTNVIRAGSRPLGLSVIFLDGLKGLIPVLAAQEIEGLQSWELAPVALAAVAGHAFSIFLRFEGGKAIAITFGIWAGLTGWSTLIVLGALLLIAYFSITGRWLGGNLHTLRTAGLHCCNRFYRPLPVCLAWKRSDCRLEAPSRPGPAA